MCKLHYQSFNTNEGILVFLIWCRGQFPLTPSVQHQLSPDYQGCLVQAPFCLMTVPVLPVREAPLTSPTMSAKVSMTC